MKIIKENHMPSPMNCFELQNIIGSKEDVDNLVAREIRAKIEKSITRRKNVWVKKFAWFPVKALTGKKDYCRVFEYIWLKYVWEDTSCVSIFDSKYRYCTKFSKLSAVYSELPEAAEFYDKEFW